MITHLGPDILECEVKWALGSIAMNKASGGDGIPAELFQILKDDAVKVRTQHASKFWKLSTGHKTGKGILYLHTSHLHLFNHSSPKERQCQRVFKLLHYCTYLTC